MPSWRVLVRYPTVVYDELVYAGFARFFSGAALMPNLYGGVYGHFGYSLLIAPVYLLRGGFERQYHANLMVNSVLMAGLYFPVFGLLRRLLPVSGQVLLWPFPASHVPICCERYPKAASRFFPGPWPLIASPAGPQRPYKAERSRLM